MGDTPQEEKFVDITSRQNFVDHKFNNFILLHTTIKWLASFFYRHLMLWTIYSINTRFAHFPDIYTLYAIISCCAILTTMIRWISPNGSFLPFYAADSLALASALNFLSFSAAPISALVLSLCLLFPSWRRFYLDSCLVTRHWPSFVPYTPLSHLGGA